VDAEFWNTAPATLLSLCFLDHRLARRFRPLIACLLLFAVPAPGQQSPSPETTIRVETSEVLVPTLVEMPSGEIVYGLVPTDFQLTMTWTMNRSPWWWLWRKAAWRRWSFKRSIDWRP
jgi:hypothetical protein